MIKLIRNVHAFGPADLGVVDILTVCERIVRIAPHIEAPGELEPQVYDCQGRLGIPGLIDAHVHICGGGGEGGPQTRTPEIMLSQITTAGITTLVGCLGTDAITRSMAQLLAKARGLEAEGISTYIYSGAYQVPTRTLLDSLREDLALIDKVVGAGEIAISDHRSAQPQVEELAKLTAEARVGGMLGDKAGIVHLHLGEGVRGLTPVYQILERTELPIIQFVPTHINRTRKLFQQGLEFLARGGNIDLTAGGDDLADGVPVPSALMQIRARFAGLERVTVSSDGNGSLPVFDEHGKLTGLAQGSVKVLWQDIKTAVLEQKLPLAEVLPVVTSNVAKVLKLHFKGELKPGHHADIVILNQDMSIDKVFALGKLMVSEGRPLVWGTFEHKQ